MERLKKISLPGQSDHLLVSTKANRVAIHRAVQAGRLRRLAPKIYSSNFQDAPEKIIRAHCWALAGALFPGALIVDRTALEQKPAADGSVFLVTDQRATDLSLPGLTFRPRQGPPPIQGYDLPFLDGLWMSSQARALLDNLRPTRQRRHIAATLTRGEIELFLEKLLRQGGESVVNRLRDQARELGGLLGQPERAEELSTMIGALSGTREARLGTAAGRARSRGEGYDMDRLQLFETLRAALALHPLARRAARPGHSFLPFFESYFSNFIEGTEFEVGEAYAIVYEGRIPPGRPEDAHDVLGTFRVVSDVAEMRRTADSAEEFLHLLQHRHGVIMGERPERSPGRFKSANNRAGDTLFVEPDLVAGTLRRGFALLPTLTHPLARAIYAMFLVAEVHPFADGNGRVARVMMNAELCRGGLERIIIPSVFRTEYLQALRALTHNQRPDAIISVMDYAQRFTAAVDFSDYGPAVGKLDECHAFAAPADAMGSGLKLVLPSDG